MQTQAPRPPADWGTLASKCSLDEGRPWELPTATGTLGATLLGHVAWACSSEKVGLEAGFGAAAGPSPDSLLQRTRLWLGVRFLRLPRAPAHLVKDFSSEPVPIGQQAPSFQRSPSWFTRGHLLFADGGARSLGLQGLAQQGASCTQASQFTWSVCFGACGLTSYFPPG